MAKKEQINNIRQEDVKREAPAVEAPETAEENMSWLGTLRTGQTVSYEFFKNNAWLILVFVVATIALIGLRYKTKIKREEINKLRIELQVTESEKLREKAEYMSLIRETEMKKMVREKGLPLEFQEQPPYRIIQDK